MNKTELLTDLLNRDFVGELVGEPKCLETLQGFDPSGKLADTDVKVYVQRYLEVVGLAARPREVRLFIKGEGKKEKEEAFYVDNEPTRSIPIWEAAADMKALAEPV